MKPSRSRIYDCFIFHSRNLPVAHQFSYSSFFFCIDLDEVETLSGNSFLIGSEKFRPFRFVPGDSILGSTSKASTDLKKAVIQYAQQKGVNENIARVEYLGNLRTFGYSYNPASFFFGYDSNDVPLFGIVEVTNTFREKKAYFVQMKNSKMVGQQEKLFYVSPFSDLDSNFNFILSAPEKTLNLQIDSVKKTEKDKQVKVHAIVSGKVKSITSGKLIRAIFQYPLTPLMIMAKIHYQALKLYLKGVPFLKKNSKAELQQGGLS